VAHYIQLLVVLRIPIVHHRDVKLRTAFVKVSILKLNLIFLAHGWLRVDRRQLAHSVHRYVRVVFTKRRLVLSPGRLELVVLNLDLDVGTGALLLILYFSLATTLGKIIHELDGVGGGPFATGTVVILRRYDLAQGVAFVEEGPLPGLVLALVLLLFRFLLDRLGFSAARKQLNLSEAANLLIEEFRSVLAMLLALGHAALVPTHALVLGDILAVFSAHIAKVGDLGGRPLHRDLFDLELFGVRRLQLLLGEGVLEVERLALHERELPRFLLLRVRQPHRFLQFALVEQHRAFNAALL